MELYIGLMSGTSVDGIDAALIDFSKEKPKLIATHYAPYKADLRKKIIALCQQGENEIERMGELDILLGREFAHAANILLAQQALKPTSIKAIGSHGQTIRHAPHARFTVQIGDPNTIVALTGITTVADFRRKDIALGGQGAPLVPAFHQSLFASSQFNRAIVNIGGIANITILPKKNTADVIGFDTGPGNVLLDSWIDKHLNNSYDKNGDWGSQGKIHPSFLTHLLSDDYFNLSAPKSTGREHFNFNWLQQKLKTFVRTLEPIDVQATLVELTATHIISAIKQYFYEGEILICGGGAHNHFLMHRLQELATSSFIVTTTKKYDVDPDWIEAMAFAWLARQTLNQQPGNVPSVTGARAAVTLGGIYY